MKEHQKRVIDEKQELDGKLSRLHKFFEGEVFLSLPPDEQARLLHQAEVMDQYSTILRERIEAFEK